MSSAMIPRRSRSWFHDDFCHDSATISTMISTTSSSTISDFRDDDFPSGTKPIAYGATQFCHENEFVQIPATTITRRSNSVIIAAMIPRWFRNDFRDDFRLPTMISIRNKVHYTRSHTDEEDFEITTRISRYLRRRLFIRRIYLKLSAYYQFYLF